MQVQAKGLNIKNFVSKTVLGNTPICSEAWANAKEMVFVIT